MADPVGKPQAVKARLNAYVTAALTSGTFKNDWHISVSNLDRGDLPLTTARFGKYDLVNENYDRRTPEQGYWAMYDFTVFLHEERDSQYGVATPDNYLTLDAIDDIIDYLNSIKGDSTEMSTHNIVWIDNIVATRENISTNPRNISTWSIRGIIYAKWEDD